MPKSFLTLSIITVLALVVAAMSNAPGARPVTASEPARSALPNNLDDTFNTEGCNSALQDKLMVLRQPLQVLVFVDVTVQADGVDGGNRFSNEDSLRQQLVHLIADLLLIDSTFRKGENNHLTVFTYAETTTAVGGLDFDITPGNIKTVHGNINGLSAPIGEGVNFDVLFEEMLEQVQITRTRGLPLVLILNDMWPNGINTIEGDFAKSAYGKWTGQDEPFPPIYMLDFSADRKDWRELEREDVRENWQEDFFGTENEPPVQGALRSVGMHDRLYVLKRILAEVTGENLFKSLLSEPVTPCPFSDEMVVAFLFDPSDPSLENDRPDLQPMDSSNAEPALSEIAKGAAYTLIFRGRPSGGALNLPDNKYDREVLFAQRSFGGVRGLRCPPAKVGAGDFVSVELELLKSESERSLSLKWSIKDHSIGYRPTPDEPEESAQNTTPSQNITYRWSGIGPLALVEEDTEFEITITSGDSEIFCYSTVVPKPVLTIKSVSSETASDAPVAAIEITHSDRLNGERPEVVLHSLSDPTRKITLTELLETDSPPAEPTAVPGTPPHIVTYEFSAPDGVSLEEGWLLRAELDAQTRDGITVHLYKDLLLFPATETQSTPMVHINAIVSTTHTLASTNSLPLTGTLPFTLAALDSDILITATSPLSYTATVNQIAINNPSAPRMDWVGGLLIVLTIILAVIVVWFAHLTTKSLIRNAR